MNDEFQQWERVSFISDEMDKSTKTILCEIIKQIIKDGLDVVTFDFNSLQHCIAAQNEPYQSLMRLFLSKYDRISRIKYMHETENKYEIITLFNKLKMNKEQKKISVMLNPAAESYFNRLAVSNWTPDEVTEYITMPSEYARKLFRLLRSCRENCCLVTIGDLRRILDVPESCGLSVLEHEILEPAIKENKHIFSNLIYREIHAPVRRNRRAALSRASITAESPITGFQFYWNSGEVKNFVNKSANEEDGQTIGDNEDYAAGTSANSCTSTENHTIIKKAPPGYNPYISLVHSYIEENGKNGACAFEHDQMTDFFGLDKNTLSKQAVKQILLDAVEGLKSKYESINVSEAKGKIDGKICTFYIIKYKELQ